MADPDTSGPAGNLSDAAHSGEKTAPGQGEWGDGAWTNKPGLKLPSIAGDGTTKVTSTSTTTGSLKPKQKPSPGDRELNQGGQDNDANDSSTDGTMGSDTDQGLDAGGGTPGGPAGPAGGLGPPSAGPI